MKNYLYLDSKRFKNIDEYLEENDGEFADEGMEAMYDRLGWSLNKNIEAAILAHNQIVAKIASIKTEIARMREYQTSEESKLKAIEKGLKYALEAKGMDRIDCGINSIALQKCPPSLPPAEEIDEGKIPDEYWKVVPETRKVMRVLLLKAVKTKVVEGINLITDRKRLKVT